MDRSYYIKLAEAGLRMPIGTHLVLHEHPDHEAIVLNGTRLGEVVEEAATEFDIPMAFPLMDLSLEKEAMLLSRGVPECEIDGFHFSKAPENDREISLTPRMEAVCGSIRYIREKTDLLPVGMGIGPFSLMTKLVSDPITPVFFAGAGMTDEEEPDIRLVERLLEVAEKTILTYLRAQISAGAKAIVLCEPAANKVYFSPNQLEESYETFDRYVMDFNRRIREELQAKDVDLIFHNCGELLDGMVSRFASLDPAMLSLGSSRLLWEDAALVPKSVVLYGNLPTKQFYSDSVVDIDKVRQLSSELTQQMQKTGHPFVLGSECDVLSVPGREATIRSKVDAFLQKGRSLIHHSCIEMPGNIPLGDLLIEKLP